MCADFALLKFNSDEKQLTPHFISVFASDCILTQNNGLASFMSENTTASTKVFGGFGHFWFALVVGKFKKCPKWNY